MSQNLANIYSDTGCLEEAEKQYIYLNDLISQLDPNYLDFYRKEIFHFYLNYGLLFIKFNAFEKAKHFLSISLEHSEIIYNKTKNSKQLCRALELLAYCNLKTETYEDALLYIDRAIEAAPYEANYYDFKGEILLLVGDTKNAKLMWDKVIELDNNFLQTHQSVLYEKLKEKNMVK